MATQKIGLEAVFDISKFTSSANSYKRELANLNTATTTTANSIAQSGSAFRQAAAAVGVYASALTKLANIADTIPQSMRRATDSVKKNNKALKKAGRTTQDYKRELGGLSEATRETSKGLKQAGSGISDYKRQIESLEQTTIRSKVSLEQTGSSIGSIGAIAGGAAVAGVAALTAAVGALGVGLAASVGEAANFEQSIADIAAVTGNSIEAVGELKDLALDLSLDPNLSVTAGEAASAIEVLAKNGVEADKILSGIGKSTVEIANATGEDFALAADVATDALNLFGVEAENFSRVGDNITGVLVNSKFGLNDVRLALAQGGAVAANAGIEFDEFASIIAATSSNFASGSDAGTAFKTFIQRLTAPTGKAKDQLEQLGISVFDAEGNMRSMTDIFEQFRNIGDVTVAEGFTIGGRTEEQEKQLADYRKQLEKVNEETREWELNLSAAAIASTEDERIVKMDRLAIETANVTKEIARLEAIQGKTIDSTRKLTEQEKQQALTTIFGADAIRFATGAMNLQEGQLEELQKAINQEGLAQQAAATRTQTLGGAIDRLKSAYEFLKISVGTPLLSPLTAFFDDTVTPGIRLLGQLADGITDIQKGGNKLAGLAIDLGFGAETIGDINEISAAFGESYEAGIELAKAKAVTVTEELFADIFSGIDFSSIGAQLSDLAFDFGFSVDTANQIYDIGQAFDEGLLPGLQAISDFVGGLDVSGGGLLAALGFSEETITLAQSFATQITDLFGLFTSFDLEGLGEFDFGNLISTFIEGASGARNEILSGITNILTPIIDGFVDFTNSPDFIGGIDTVTTAIADTLVAGITTSAEELPELVGVLTTLSLQIGKGLVAAAGVIALVAGQLAAKLVQGFTEYLTGSELEISTVSELTSILSRASELTVDQGLQAFNQIGIELINGIVSGLELGVGVLTSGIFAISEQIANSFREFFGIASPSTLFAEFGLNLIQGLVQGIINNASLVATALTSTIGQGIASFGEGLQLPELGLSELLTGGEDGEGEAGGIFEFAKGIKDNLGSALEETGDIVSATVAPAFEDVGAATGIFSTEASESANVVNGQLTPALSRVGSIAGATTAPALKTASDAIQQNTQQAQKLASILNGTLNSASETFAELWQRIGTNAEEAIEPLTEVKNLLGEIAGFLQAIQAAGGGSGGQAAQAAGGASTAGATTAGAFQSFSNVRNTSTNNTFNLTVNSSQSSRGVIGDFGRLQALV